ncbi:L-serine ammonia-lyase [Coxiella endosymbiont of Amblyomma sculptum]|uniref:L-serine ammonia-lyase n=1 Tax=Coxiella endosymbiont of Amblyomma sculptum TaxID=2487929 RepID=UPI00132E73E1|nr:L-serine ammonia-lyase [Coxiella endosymbiont of Amblyomma sculptum]QHG92422.1 L-serine ammonia-lyase [Coxiella endosymbiont of Amblyomma sculptum]
MYLRDSKKRFSTISVFDLFSIGIGPSSSHTVGPMKAANDFVQTLRNELTRICQITITLYGSLAFTGKGHSTDKAVIMGLIGREPETIDPDSIDDQIKTIWNTEKLRLLEQHSINFSPRRDIIFNYQTVLTFHPNGLKFKAYDVKKTLIKQSLYFSIGGGFIVGGKNKNKMQMKKTSSLSNLSREIPYPFVSAAELVSLAQEKNLSIADIMLTNERQINRNTAEDAEKELLRIADIMEDCINKGCRRSGNCLVGPLQVRRRAPSLYRKLLALGPPTVQHPQITNWLNVYAMAVSEENASGGRIVTAPTNGAAGIIPSVLNYYKHFLQESTVKGVVNFLLTAGAIGILYKQNASISGAEMGCQGEVGVACSMAAAGLVAAMGGTVLQIENAAEIAIEHNFGLTCDPVGGLVQIPCIERNAMGSVKAFNAAQLALSEDGRHKISLDMAINTMREVGRNMNSIYKETSKGGLAIAVNIVEC